MKRSDAINNIGEHLEAFQLEDGINWDIIEYLELFFDFDWDEE